MPCAAGLDGGHLAFNYWYHPPDNLDPSKAGFKQPYTGPYYPTVWANRRSWLQAETQTWWKQQQQHSQLPGQQKQPHSKQQRQQQQDGDGSSSASKRRRIKWAPTVADVGNVYEAFNTRAGTATGSFKVLPQHSGLRWASALTVPCASSSWPHVSAGSLTAGCQHAVQYSSNVKIGLRSGCAQP
jgi:hypothetical protein